MKKTIMVVTTLCVAVLNICSASAQMSQLHINSSSGSYVGQGQHSFDLQSSDGYLFQADSVRPGMVRFDIHNADNSVSWTLTVASILPGHPDLHLGTYNDAVCSPFGLTGQPILSLAGNGRSYSLALGSFKITEFERESGILTKATIQFEQRGEDYGSHGSCESGYLHYENPLSAITVPEPSIATLVLCGTGLLLFRRK